MPSSHRPLAARRPVRLLAVPGIAVLAALTAVVAQAPPPPPVMPPPSMVGPGSSQPKRPQAPGKQTVAAVAVRLVPRAWRYSTYSLEGRVETGVDDVTVEVPPAYHESFAFWTDRMKGSSRAELIQYLTTTREPAEDGLLPFRRQVGRYLIDMNERGEAKAAGGPFIKDVLSLAWEGAYDPRGNVIGLKRVAGPDDMSSIDRLAFPVLDLLFPTLDEEREMKPGDAFTQEVQMRLPSPLTIAGLDKTAVRLTRRYTLREVQGQEATFDVAVIYAVDPATPPTAPRTTCVITGGGTGKATFDLGQGVFVRAEQQTHLVIDVEAPLRRLPDQAPDVDPGTGKSHLTIFLNVSGKQKVAQLFESPPQADAPSGPEASPQPAPQGGAGPE